jgi:hypothetical protein
MWLNKYFFAVLSVFCFVLLLLFHVFIYLFICSNNLTCCWFLIWWSTQYTEIAKKEKVGSRKKKLPIKTTTPEELCAFYTPQELYEKYTSDQLRQKFGLPKLHEILPRNLLALMVFPRPVFRYLASCFS